MPRLREGSAGRAPAWGRCASILVLVCASTGAVAASGDAGVDGAALPLAWVLPFAGLLASIALAPLLVPKLWHRRLGTFAFAWAMAFLVPFAIAFGAMEALRQVTHAALLEYVPFVVLLFALYTVAGGIGLFGDLRGTPVTNTTLLAIGAVLANLMGTTGAAMVLVRPLIRANEQRRHNVHVMVFFIFLVANAGGALTPLGDPPLFLGFLQGVSFFWTTTALLAPALTLWGCLLAIFFVLDRHLSSKAGERTPPARHANVDTPLRLEGRGNLLLLVAIVAVVLASGFWRPGIRFDVLGTTLELQNVVRDLLLVAIAAASLAITPDTIHRANGFVWEPMREVATLFAAIFVTIVPAIAILKAGDAGALSSLTTLVTRADGQPDASMYFWLTGLLSAFLDNAPTYLVFFNLAGADARALMAHRETLAAISGGAVFMGALTYIGNAPNFMVRAIAVERGIRMPSFFGYLLWSVPVLVPIFVLLTILFFH